MSKDIVVLAPNGRRQTVKCSLNTTMLQILEEVCKKQGFDPNKYDLTHHNKVLDLTNTIRFSNLPNKANLEMAEVERPRLDNAVTIGLQLESGERPLGEFSPQTTLYEVLERLAQAELAAYQHPTVIYTRREVYGETELRQTNLKHLGLTGGRAMLRLINKSPDELKTQANVSSVLPPRPAQPKEPIPSTSKDTQPGVSKRSNSDPKPGPSDVHKDIPANTHNTIKLIKEEIKKACNVNAIDESDELKAADGSESMDVEDVVMSELGGETMCEGEGVNIREDKMEFSQAEEEQLQRRLNIEQEVSFLGEKKAIAFEQSGTEPELADLPDDFYELSVEEVRRLYHELRHQTTAAVNAPLLTARQRTNRQQEKEQGSTHKHAVVRVQFPDRIVLQGVFDPTDTIRQVYSFTQQYLHEPQRPFHLFTTPTRETLDPDVSLLEARFVPGVLMHFRWADEGNNEGPFLKADIYMKKTSTEAAAMLASKYRAAVRRMPDEEAGASCSRANDEQNAASASSKRTKLLKLFKI